jgi:hypothetical protein
MSQRDYGLQPRVAVSATLGTSEKRVLNRNAVASFFSEKCRQLTQPRCG